MLMIQMTGLSGAGKSSIAMATSVNLLALGYKVQLLDGDECRQSLCRDLGFSREDRLENIRRLGFVGQMLARHGVISILAAINPYEEGRKALQDKSNLTRTIYIKCPLDVTVQRDTKGLYRKALLPIGHPDHVGNLSGISDPYEAPADADLVIVTDIETVNQSAARLTDFILQAFQQQEGCDKPTR